MSSQSEMRNRLNELGSTKLTRLTVAELSSALEEYVRLSHVVRTFPAAGNDDEGPSQAVKDAVDYMDRVNEKMEHVEREQKKVRAISKNRGPHDSDKQFWKVTHDKAGAPTIQRVEGYTS